MSPVSKGRKGKRKGTASRGQGVPAGPALLEPVLGGLVKELVHAFRPMVREREPLEAEVLASSMLGSWWKRLPPGQDLEVSVGVELVDYAARSCSRESLAALRAMAVVGVSEQLRGAATVAADRIAAEGVADPAWAPKIGRVEVGDCWRMADVFGDQASLFIEFGYGSKRHGVVALVDFNHLGGWVKDLIVTPEPRRVLRELRKAAMAEPHAILERLDAAEARRLIEDGLAATDMTWEPEVSDELRQFRALVLARCRALPEPPPRADEEREVSEAEREAIVGELLASPHAAGLGDRDVAGYCARLLVDFGADYDAGKPLRASPAKIHGFLLGWVPAKATLDEAERAALPAVVSAWARWAGERAGLPERAIDALVETTADCAEDFDEAYANPVNASPLKLLLQGVEAADEAALEDAVDRRVFAMPFFGATIGGEDFPRLDPGDPDERRLLIQGEHPEYHDALADPEHSGEVDGVNPRLHIAMHEIVANQLWDDDPPETWRAARRLRAAGMDRHDVLHQLCGPVASFVHGALTSGQPVDQEAFRQALDALQPPARGRRAKARHARTVVARPSKNAVYQVKVGLVGAKPPIWRRLRVPAGTSLADFHHVIQAAFGWLDGHLHEFEADGLRYSLPEFELDEWGEEVADERAVTLREVASGEGARLRYTYDFGDSWEHDVRVEKVLPTDGVPHAVCVGGRRAGPPEDCGGIWGYAELCEALADPDNPEHHERLDWLGHDHDPAAFDRDEVSRALAKLRLG